METENKLPIPFSIFNPKEITELIEVKESKKEKESKYIKTFFTLIKSGYKLTTVGSFKIDTRTANA